MNTPPTGLSKDPYVNNVYIAWASIDTAPSFPTITKFNPNRAEIIVGTPITNPSVPNEESLAFSGVTTLNLGGNLPVTPQLNAHPQLVISPVNATTPGEITVGWEDDGSGASASPPVTFLLSSLVGPGNSYGFTGATGPFVPAVSNNSPGNWSAATVYSAGVATSLTPADPVGIAVQSTVNASSTNVDGKNGNDIIVADQGTGQIGILLNSGTGTFGTTGVALSSGSPSGVILGDFVSGHSNVNILDAAMANGSSSGGVTVSANGTNPNDGQGNFLTASPLPPVPGGSGETAIVNGDIDGNGIPDIVAADPGNGSIDIWFNPAASGGATSPISLALPGGYNPIAVVVDKFRGTSELPDIVVLNSNGKIVVFDNGITTGTPTAADFTRSVLPFTISNPRSMTSGSVTGNAAGLPDLILVSNNGFGQPDLSIVQNLWTSGTSASFASPFAVIASSFAGTPVPGEQGVATGKLSTLGNYSSFQDIAVVYAAAGTGESMVAVFQNLDDTVLHAFSRSLADFDALQKNPTAIALLNLTNSTTNPWQDIVVTNNDNSKFAGSVSVFQPTTATTVTTPKSTLFTDVVSVPSPSLVNDLTVTVDLVDFQTVGRTLTSR